MCDADCQARIIANADSEVIEAENVILLLVFFMLVSLVYVTGLIVWVWCNRNPTNGISAVAHTNVVAQRRAAAHGRSQVSHGGYGPVAGVRNDSADELLLVLGALMDERNGTRLANNETGTASALMTASERVQVNNKRGRSAAEVIIETRRVPHCTASITAAASNSNSSSNTSTTSTASNLGGPAAGAKTASIVLRPGSDLEKPEVVVHTIAEV